MSPRSVVATSGRVVTDARRRASASTAPAPFACPRWHDLVRQSSAAFRGRVAVLIWRRPWMTIAARHLRVVACCGCSGGRTCWPAPTDRYPEATLEQLAGLAPELVLLPDEPYPFAARHVAEVAAAVPTARVALVDGQDLFWWGIRTPDALERLSRPPTGEPRYRRGHAAHALRRRPRALPRLRPRRSSPRSSCRTPRSGSRPGSSTARSSPRPARRGSSAWRCPRSTAAGASTTSATTSSSRRRSSTAGVNAAGLGWTLHNDICLPYFLTLCTEEQKAALAARDLLGRAHHRDRDDRAGHRLGPRVDVDDARSSTATTTS